VAGVNILWDASGLIKRYLIEIGSETIDAIFDEAADNPVSVTSWGYLETYSILRRRFNAGAFQYNAFANAVTALQAEVIGSGGFGFIPIMESAIFGATSLIDGHQINSADAAILSAYLRCQSRQPSGILSCLLVASDKRLLRAALAEGLHTLNPELMPPGDVSGFLRAL